MKNTTTKTKKFHLELPEAIRLSELKFTFTISDASPKVSFDAEVIDEGGGAFMQRTMPEAVGLDVKKLKGLTDLLIEVADFINRNA